MTDLEKAQEAEIKGLKKRVCMEAIRRLSMEMKAAEATMAAIQLRAPSIELEMDAAQKMLAALTEKEDGKSGN